MGPGDQLPAAAIGIWRGVSFIHTPISILEGNSKRPGDDVAPVRFPGATFSVLFGIGLILEVFGRFTNVREEAGASGKKSGSRTQGRV